MTVALPRRGQGLLSRNRGLPRWLRPNVPWTITLTYLSLVLFLPLAGMLLKAAGVGPAAFWETATSPLALSTYPALAGIVAGTWLAGRTTTHQGQ
jgi:ABC-type sulfate transport system permease component